VVLGCLITAKNSLAQDSTAVRRTFPDTVGLNPAMFRGIDLTSQQIDSILRLGRIIHEERAKQSKGQSAQKFSDLGTRQRVLSEIERERQLYRAILTEKQWQRFDLNTEAILRQWKSSGQVPTRLFRKGKAKS
jgi:hypothetical protein